MYSSANCKKMNYKRKTKLETVLIPRSTEILKMLDQGISENEIAKRLDISYSTWRSYKKKFIEYLQTKEETDEQKLKDVEQAMYESAIGITKKIKRAMKVKTVEYDNGKRLKEEEKIEYYYEEIYIPPSVSAGQFLLKNWGKANYSNNPAELDVKKEEFEFKKSKDDW